MAKLPGSAWISGTNIHFINESGVEYYYTGWVHSTPGGLPGSVWSESEYVIYIDEYGTKRVLNYTYDATGVAALAGSIWVEGSRIKSITAASHKANSHDDVAGVSIPHTDVPHTDGGGGHSDSHGDSHGDGGGGHSDNPHDDLSHDDLTRYCDAHYDIGGGAEHQDAIFIGSDRVCHGDYYPAEPGGHGDAHVDDGIHSDQSGHIDIPHGDFSDSHSDAHDDGHGDSASHADVPHTDVPHSDVVHSDQPVYIGP